MSIKISIKEDLIRIKSLTERTERTKMLLLKGLKETQAKTGGWPSRQILDKKATSVWTASQVLTAMLMAGEYPKHYEESLQLILKQKKGAGWELRSRIPGYPNIYVTAEAINAFCWARHFKEMEDSIILLQESRSHEGWGVIPGDDEPKIKPTTWALLALLEARKVPQLRKLIDDKKIQKSVDWLLSAKSKDGAWGYRPNQTEGNITGTSMAIIALLRAKDQSFKVDGTVVKQAIEWLKKKGHNGEWRGVPEDFDISVNGKYVGHHYTAGLGTTAVLLALTSAASYGIIEISDEAILDGVDFLLTCCKPFPPFKGVWMIPSSLGSEEPTIWDSAYAIEALLYFEKYLLRYLIGALVEQKATNLETEFEDLRKEVEMLREKEGATQAFIESIVQRDPGLVGEVLFHEKERRELLEEFLVYELLRYAATTAEGKPIPIESLREPLTKISKMESEGFGRIIDIAQIARSILSDDKRIFDLCKILTQKRYALKQDDTISPTSVDAVEELLASDSLLQMFRNQLFEEARACIQRVFEKPVSVKASIEDFCMQKLREKGYSITEAKNMKGIHFDFISEKSLKGWKGSLKGLLGMKAYAVSCIHRKEIGVNEIKKFVADVDEAFELEKGIAEAYIFGCDFTNATREFVEKLKRKKYELILLSYGEEQ